MHYSMLNIITYEPDKLIQNTAVRKHNNLNKVNRMISRLPQRDNIPESWCRGCMFHPAHWENSCQQLLAMCNTLSEISWLWDIRCGLCG